MSTPRKHAYLKYQHAGIRNTLMISGPTEVFQDEALHLDLADMAYGDFSNYLTHDPAIKFELPSNKKRLQKNDSVTILWEWNNDYSCLSFLLPFAINVSSAHPELVINATRHLPHYAMEISLKDGHGEKVETSVVDYQVLETTKASGRKGEVIRRQTLISPDLSALTKEEVFTNNGHFTEVQKDQGSFENTEGKNYSLFDSSIY